MDPPERTEQEAVVSVVGNKRKLNGERTASSEAISAPLVSSTNSKTTTKPILKKRRTEKSGHGSQNALPAPSLNFMDDAQALAFLTSPQVLQEWPFMADLHFLVTVITDMTQPDYPVIYASDSFEGMTLYPKKDILGSNLRILQGKCTNKETLQKLRTAIHSGEQVEAHILNYRKDGTPFWNKFMALPIKDNEGRLTHYVGIQQDVTMLTEMGSNPRQWTSAEVGMWLDHIDLGDYSLKAIEKDIVGADLFSKDRQHVVSKLEISNEHDRRYLVKRIKRLLRNPQLSFSSSFSSLDFSASALSLHNLAQQISGSGPKKVRFDPATFCRQEGQERITVRCFYRERLHLFSIHHDTTFNRLRNKVRSLFPRLHCIIQQVQDERRDSPTVVESGVDVFSIHNDIDLQQAILRVLDSRTSFGTPVMKLRLTPPTVDLTDCSTSLHASTPSLPTPSASLSSLSPTSSLSLSGSSPFFSCTSHSLAEIITRSDRKD